MGRGKRQSVAPSPSWIWESEPLPTGQLHQGIGRDGNIFLLEGEDTFLRVGDGIDYERGVRLEEDALLVGSGENVFAFSGGKLLRLAPDRSESEPYPVEHPLALLPTRDGIRFVYGDGQEVFQTDFSEDIFSPEGEYLLLASSAEIAAPLAAPGSGGLALLSGSNLHYIGPSESRSWQTEIESGEISISGDPYDPHIVLLDRLRRRVFFPGTGEVDLGSGAEDYHIWQQGREKLFIASLGDKVARFSGGNRLQDLPITSSAGRILPGKSLLLASDEGLYLWDWDGQHRQEVSKEIFHNLEIAVHDERDVEVLADRRMLLRGEVPPR